jgi:hypothetical protein
MTLYMGKPLMLRDEDDRRIVRLKARLRAPSKVDVVRSGLDLLEREADRRDRIARWRRATALARESSLEFLRDVGPPARRRLARLD